MTTNQPHGYLAEPAKRRGPAIVLLHAWWGLNDTIRQFCDRLAEEGYVVFAPDLYHGKVATTIEQAEALAQNLEANSAAGRTEVLRSAEFLLSKFGQAEQRLAAIGFSLGAQFALNLAAAKPEAVDSVVLYYGVGPADFSRLKADLLGHFATDDIYEPQENVQWLESELRKGGCAFEFHHYPGTKHWFAEADRKSEYQPESAELAWTRTVAFLDRKIDRKIDRKTK